MLTISRTALVLLLAAAAIAGAAAGAPSLLAQGGAGSSGPSSDAAIAALVSEVRALRAEISEAARSTLRSQLLVARLQLQEQRILHLDRQRADVASKAAAVAQRRVEAATALRMMEGENPMHRIQGARSRRC